MNACTYVHLEHAERILNEINRKLCNLSVIYIAMIKHIYILCKLVYFLDHLLI